MSLGDGNRPQVMIFSLRVYAVASSSRSSSGSSRGCPPGVDEGNRGSRGCPPGEGEGEWSFWSSPCKSHTALLALLDPDQSCRAQSSSFSKLL